MYRSYSLITCFALVVSAYGNSTVLLAEGISTPHQDYAQTLWKYLNRGTNGYKTWASGSPTFDFGPPTAAHDKSYLNSRASSSNDYPYGSCVVTEHFSADDDLRGVTVRLRVKPEYDSRTNDWYWAHFTSDGKLATCSAEKNPFGKRGFVARLEDGRLWVFRAGSPELAEYLANGELAKHVIRPGAGPQGLTLKGPDKQTLLEYVAAKPGFVTLWEDGRMWIFEERSEALKAFREHGEPAKLVVWPGAGPNGMTLKAADTDTLEKYLVSKPGFATKVVDGRVWVFRDDAEELKEFEGGGELAKHVIRPGAGPRGMTLKSPDSDTVLMYLASRPGFATLVRDGRIWVLKDGSPELEVLSSGGELAKHVIRPGAGPLGATLKAPDSETVNAYLRAQ